MGMRTVDRNGQNPDAQQPGGQQDGIAVSHNAMIDALMQRVQQLTMENVMLQAAINQLQGGDNGNPVPEGEMVHQGE